jgi:hypothetical protein
MKINHCIYRGKWSVSHKFAKKQDSTESSFIHNLLRVLWSLSSEYERIVGINYY